MLERAISFSPGSEEVINDRGAPLDAKVDVVEKTPWIDADDAIIVKGPAGQFKSVRCRVTESNILDKFDFPVGSPIEVCIKHQYYDTKLKVWSRDIASSLVTPHSYNDVQTQDALQVGLKGRFGTAIDRYLRIVAKEDRPIPIAFLSDRVYPDVVTTLIANSVRTVNDLASMDDDTVLEVKDALRDANYANWANLAPQFRQRAREFLEDLGISWRKAAADEEEAITEAPVSAHRGRKAAA